MLKGLDPSQQYFIVSVICAGLGYLTYWIIGSSDAFVSLFTRNGKGSVPEVVARRLFGFFIMGVVPALVIWFTTFKTPGQMGLNFEWNMRVLYWLIGLGIPSILVNWAAGHNADNNETYPQIRVPQWTTGTFIIEYLTWALYLLGYEFLFRGLLLYASLEIMSVPAAVTLNVLIYAFAHLPKGNKETIGSILLGTLMCIAVIRTGSMWIAFVVHIIIAWSNSIFSFILNPHFKYAGK